MTALAHMNRVHTTSMMSEFAKLWLANNQVLCYRLCNTQRATIDQWHDDLSAELDIWSLVRPYRLLLDLRGEHMIISAYALRRARTLAALRPDLPGKTALLVSTKLTSNVVSLAVRSVRNQFRERLVFQDEMQAVAWLLEDDTIAP